MLSFSSQLDASACFKDWISVDKGMRVKNATYDAATYSVVFDFTTPLEPGQAYRVEVNQEAVCGLRGESLSPAAQARYYLKEKRNIYIYTHVCGLRGESLSPAAQARLRLSFSLSTSLSL